MTNFNSYGATQQAYQQPYSQYFPQPQGSIYMINSSNDVANVPVGAGISAAICLKDGIMYLKTIQNGSPMLLGYRLSSLEDANNSNSFVQAPVRASNEEFDKRVSAALDDYGQRLEKIEAHLSKAKQGGTGEWQF